METDTEKHELIEKYRAAMKNKPCKYFARGSTSEGPNDECPFGNKCFYKVSFQSLFIPSY